MGLERSVVAQQYLSLTPQRNELASLHVPGQTRGPVGEAHGHGVHSPQDELALVHGDILGVLNEKDIHAFF
jgi:hypothetical protein